MDVVTRPAPHPIITPPDAEPVFVGVNVIDITSCAPGAIAMNGVIPLTEYMSPVRFSLSTCAVVVPVFVMVT